MRHLWNTYRRERGGHGYNQMYTWRTMQDSVHVFPVEPQRGYIDGEQALPKYTPTPFTGWS